MARAKRTDRSEARRQYRAYLAAQAEAEAATANEAEEAAPAPKPSRWSLGARPAAATATAGAGSATAREVRPRPAGAGPQAPMGFFAGMRAAYRQINYRDDFRYLPTLVTRTHAVWPGVLLSIAAMVILIVDADPADFWVGTAGLALPPYPLIPVMLAGVLAPRAAWLAGAITGLVAGICVSVVIAVAATRFPLLRDQAGSQLVGIALEWTLVAICFGALVGALSAWYRRFLSLVMVPKNPSGRSSSRSSAKRPARRPTTTRK